MVPKLAKILAVSLEELLGTGDKPAKPGPTPKLQKQLEQVGRLPRSKRKFVMEMLDTVIKQQNAG